MKQIPLHSKKYPGKVMLCSDSKYKMLSLHRWHPVRWRDNFYARTKIKGENVSAHRLILGVTDPKIHVDHAPDRSGLNNTDENIRVCTMPQNQWNRTKTKANTSGFKGVSWDKHHKHWRAGIKKYNKYYHLGNFTTPEEAYAAYCKAAKELHGDFANTE